MDGGSHPISGHLGVCWEGCGGGEHKILTGFLPFHYHLTSFCHLTEHKEWKTTTKEKLEKLERVDNTRAICGIRIIRSLSAWVMSCAILSHDLIHDINHFPSCRPPRLQTFQPLTRQGCKKWVICVNKVYFLSQLGFLCEEL